jgi:hypothetical protein
MRATGHMHPQIEEYIKQVRLSGYTDFGSGPLVSHSWPSDPDRSSRNHASAREASFEFHLLRAVCAIAAVSIALSILTYGRRWPHVFPYDIAEWPRFWIPLLLSFPCLLAVRRLALGVAAEWLLAVPLIWVCAGGAHDFLTERNTYRKSMPKHHVTTHSARVDSTLKIGQGYQHPAH